MQEELKAFVKEFERMWLGVFLTFLMATINGTVFWALYPHLHNLFPSAASSNIIAEKLGWWNAVCICWMCGLLFKSDAKPKIEKPAPEKTETNS